MDTFEKTDVLQFNLYKMSRFQVSWCLFHRTVAEHLYCSKFVTCVDQKLWIRGTKQTFGQSIARRQISMRIE